MFFQNSIPIYNFLKVTIIILTQLINIIELARAKEIMEFFFFFFKYGELNKCQRAFPRLELFKVQWYVAF